MQRSRSGRKRTKVVVLGFLVVSMNFTTGCALIGAILQIVSAALSISPSTRGAGQIVGVASRVASSVRRYAPAQGSLASDPRNQAGRAPGRRAQGIGSLIAPGK